MLTESGAGTATVPVSPSPYQSPYPGLGGKHAQSPVPCKRGELPFVGKYRVPAPYRKIPAYPVT